MGAKSHVNKNPRKAREPRPGPGRPSVYSPELAEEICRHIRIGRSLRKIASLPGMPEMSTMVFWVSTNREGFTARYLDARAACSHIYIEDIVDIADDATNDWEDKLNDKGEVIGKVVRAEHIARSRLRVEARKFGAAMTNPRLYGNRTVLANDADSPLTNPDSDSRAAAVLQGLLGLLQESLEARAAKVIDAKPVAVLAPAGKSASAR